jgi:hypothetical protein
MNQLTPLLMGYVAPGVWRVAELGPGDQALAVARGVRWQELDLGSVDSKAALMERLAVDLELPAYFGKNWDALDECLNEAPAPGLVVISNAQGLINSEPATAASLSEVLDDACRSWNQINIDMSAIWVGAGPPDIPEIPSLGPLEGTNSV